MEDSGTREIDNRQLANAVDMDAHSLPGIKLGEGLAEGGAKMKQLKDYPDGQMGQVFIRPDGTEVELSGFPAFVAAVIGGFSGWRRR